jgi:hypothetical protein
MKTEKDKYALFLRLKVKEGQKNNGNIKKSKLIGGNL